MSRPHNIYHVVRDAVSKHKDEELEILGPTSRNFRENLHIRFCPLVCKKLVVLSHSVSHFLHIQPIRLDSEEIIADWQAPLVEFIFCRKGIFISQYIEKFARGRR